MIRSMVLACAIGALGAVGCAVTSNAADETAVAQNINCILLFDCGNSPFGGGVRCTGSCQSINAVTVAVAECRFLNDLELNELSVDLNSNSGDINILNLSDVLNRIELTVLDDFINKFDIFVTKSNVNVCSPIVQLC